MLRASIDWVHNHVHSLIMNINNEQCNMVNWSVLDKAMQYGTEHRV